MTDKRQNSMRDNFGVPNQCMGCQAGWPLEITERGHVVHVTAYPNGECEYVGCTKNRYVILEPYPYGNHGKIKS